MGKSIAGMVGTQHANWQQLTAIEALGHVKEPSTRLRQYRDVKSIVMMYGMSSAFGMRSAFVYRWVVVALGVIAERRRGKRKWNLFGRGYFGLSLL